MKVLIVNNSDISGGAARAAYRLHKALLSSGVDSLMLVQSKISDDFTVIGPETKIQKAISIIRPVFDMLPVIFYKERSKTLFSPACVPFSNVIKQINKLSPDIVHLHWINGGMMRIEDIAKISAPIVWSLHDMWLLTGGCHYDEECGAFTKCCGHCKVLGSSKKKDLSAKGFARKKRVLNKIQNLKIIGLSRWMVDCERKSSLFKDTPVYHLPNPIDTSVFSPFDKAISRTLFNLPADKKLVLFGAIKASDDPRKGFQELSSALELLDHEHVELVIFGSSKPKIKQKYKHKVYYLGHLHDDISLRVLYNAADVFVSPSLQENLSNSIMESLACGTPVVAFDIGGNSDMIEHKKNGYLAVAYSIEDLANGMEWIINHKNYNALSLNARKKVMENFDSKIVVYKYLKMYNEIINKRIYKESR